MLVDSLQKNPSLTFSMLSFVGGITQTGIHADPPFLGSKCSLGPCASIHQVLSVPS